MRRVAILLELDWHYKRHSSVVAGTQRYTEELGWKPYFFEASVASTDLAKEWVIAAAVKPTDRSSWQRRALSIERRSAALGGLRTACFRVKGRTVLGD